MSKKNLKSLRKKIDKIDQELLLLIQQRAKHAVDIGNIKSKIKYKIYDDYCQKMILYTYYPDKLNENYKYEKNNIAVKCKSNLNEEYRKLYEKYERIVDILGKFDGLSFGQLPISIVD